MRARSGVSSFERRGDRCRLSWSTSAAMRARVYGTAGVFGRTNGVATISCTDTSSHCMGKLLEIERQSVPGAINSMGKGKDQARVDAKAKRVRESGKTSVFKKGQKNDSVAAYDEATIKRLAAAYEGWQETWDCPRQGCGCLLSSAREAVPRSATAKHCTEIPSVI